VTKSEPEDKSFGPVLDGITLPDTVVLPPEIVPLLPWMSLSELKVVIAAVARLMQVGGAEPITLSEFQQMTGLSRPAVLDGIERAMKRGLLMRFEMTGYRGHTMHVYELKPRFIGKNFLPITPIKAKQSKDVVVDIDSSSTDLTLLNLSAGENFLQKTPENEAKNGLFLQLRKIGIYTKTAQFLLENYPFERIQACLELYPLALRARRANGPGWLVKAVSDPNWDLELEAADLQERMEALAHQEQQQPVEASKPTKAGLPKSVLEDLREIGWNGSTAELAEHYRADRKRFKAWLKWAKKQPRQYAAARLLNGLRSELMPPREDTAHTDFPEYLHNLEGQISQTQLAVPIPEDRVMAEVNDDVRQAWISARDQVRERMTRAAFDTWVKDAVLVGYEGNCFVVAVRNAYARDFLEERLGDLLTRLLSQYMGCPQQVVFVVQENIVWSYLSPQRG
jgi:DNA-binding Lrp family transcriptional regulator